MDDRITAVYLMVWKSELTPEDEGSYERPLARQREFLTEYMKEHWGIEPDENVRFYTSRSDLFWDIERHRIKRLIVYSLDRLAATREEIDAILFELDAEGVELLVAQDGDS